MTKRYLVILTKEEQKQLYQLIRAGKEKPCKQTRARILLKADQGEFGPACTDQQISQALEVHVTTIERLRKRFVEDGFEACLQRRPDAKPRFRRKLDGAQEAQLVTLACSTPPDGQTQWSLRLLADKLVELQVVDSISHVTVHRILKKTN